VPRRQRHIHTGRREYRSAGLLDVVQIDHLVGDETAELVVSGRRGAEATGMMVCDSLVYAVQKVWALVLVVLLAYTIIV
jgi:hypothetical protein